MLYRKWSLRQAGEGVAEQLAAQTGTPLLLCKVLAARGVDTPEALAAMLGGGDALPDPLSMQDMGRAVARIRRAIEEEEAIAVFGDYDVDGITATALMYTYLEGIGAQVSYKLPSRSDDDYGLAPALVDLAADREVSLIITVDNGTTAFEAAARAKERGVSLVVTDHHLPYDTMPEVDALVNPHRADDHSGLDGLSGVGVAFMLAAALEDCPPEELLAELGDLVAIGTVADVMKLVGENRTIVRAGLAALQETHRPGLQALIRACGWADKGVTVENISYGIAPRLNAAGRMDDATTALRLLLAKDEEEAEALVEGLQQQNVARQKLEQDILALIEQQMGDDNDLQNARVMVLWGDDWHQGVIGIVASRLVDKYAKPAIVISFDGEDGKGSGRSVAGFSLHGAIASCEDILIRYGGHDLAAGFSVKRQHVEEFRRRVNAWAAENIPVPTLPEIWADAEAGLAQLTLEQVGSLEKLAPCGSGNPVPCFWVRGAVVDSVYPVSEGKHSRLRLRQGGAALNVMRFGCGPDKLCYAAGDTVDALLVLTLYDGKQGMQVSARAAELRPAGMDNLHVGQCALLESFLAGREPVGAEHALLLPTRQDIADVYREVRAGTVCTDDIRPTLMRLGEERTGRVLTALAALDELGLTSLGQDGRCGVVAVQGKRNLTESPLLQRLGYTE